MKRPPSTLGNMLAAMTMCTLVSATALAGVHVLTRDRIALVERESRAAALRAVLPSFDSDPWSARTVVPSSRGDLSVYPVTREGMSVGIGVESFSEAGYSGHIAVTVGFDPAGHITGTLVTSHRETPGLGAKIAPPATTFASQFRGKDPAAFRLKVRKDGGDVDAITGATISSRAYCEAVAVAVETFQHYREQKP